MRTVSTTKQMRWSADLIWQVLTDWTHMGWRGDLHSIRVSQSEQEQVITETLLNGAVARFAVTKWNPPVEFEKYLTGEMVSRRWAVVLKPTGPDTTQVTLREEYTFKNRLLFLLSYCYVPIRGEQKRYFKNLEARLKEVSSSSDSAPLGLLNPEKEEFYDAKQDARP